MPTSWSRAVLYEVVWLQPMGHLSRCFHETSAKIRAECRRLNVPTPSMAYWAAIRAGDTPLKPPLPADHAPLGDDYVLLEEEVAELTGVTDTALQRAELDARQIPFAVSATGAPVVPVVAVIGPPTRAYEEVGRLNRRLRAMYQIAKIKL